MKSNCALETGRAAPGLIAVMTLASIGTAAPAAAQAQGPLGLTRKDAPPGTTIQAVLDPGATQWGAIEASRIHLNRTPPLYADGPFDDGGRPFTTVQIMAIGDTTAIRAHWKDGTEDRGPASVHLPDAGAPAVYKRHSMDVDTFADAFCVMVPSRRGAHSTYPSLMMGDKGHPTDLYYWRADKGFQVLTAHGRASTRATGKAQQGAVVRDTDGWTVTFAIPDLKAATPVAFAVWNGSNKDRDGMKWFSIWYEVR